jgi:hypothetical protein
MRVRQRVTGIDMAGLKIKFLFWPRASALSAAPESGCGESVSCSDDQAQKTRI